MAEKPKKKNEEAPVEETQAKAKSPIMKYIIMGGGGLIVILIVAFATVFMMGGSDADHSAEAEPSESTEAVGDTLHAEVGHGHAGELSNEEQFALEAESALAAEDSLFLGDDRTVLEDIIDNLDFLDYQPGQAELTDSQASGQGNDSLKQVDWLEQEKAALDKREKDLAEREREVEKLHREVSQKLLTLEQAESTRINNLAKLYDGMDQRSVAQLMANLDDETVVLILPRMKTKNASAVMSLMPPQRAAKLSKQLITIAGN